MTDTEAAKLTRALGESPALEEIERVAARLKSEPPPHAPSFFEALAVLRGSVRANR
jgi:hypothetical protein